MKERSMKTIRELEQGGLITENEKWFLATGCNFWIGDNFIATFWNAFWKFQNLSYSDQMRFQFVFWRRFYILARVRISDKIISLLTNRKK